MSINDMIISIFKDPTAQAGQYQINKKSSGYFVLVLGSLWILAALDILSSVKIDIAFWEFLTITISAYILGKSKSDGDKKHVLASGNQITSTLGFRIKFARYVLAVSVILIHVLLLIQTKVLVEGTLTPDMLFLDSTDYGSFNTLTELAIAYLVIDGVWS